MIAQFIFSALLYLTVAIVILFAFLRTQTAEASGIWLKVFVQMLVFYGAWLMPFVFVFAIYQFVNGMMATGWAVALAVFSVLYFYGRIIEPKAMQVHEHRIDMALTKPLTVAVIADVHLGLFSGYQKQLDHIVKKLNAMTDVDAVVFAGDWTYEPGGDILGKLMLLKAIKQPCYHVLGNHDEQEPGPDITAELVRALDVLHIENIEAKSVDLGAVNLVGVGDLWASKAEFHHFSYDDINDKPTIILAHNPDTVDYIPNELFDARPLMVSGHTHGGQVALPFLRDYGFKKHSTTGYVEGLYQHKKAQVFVTAGTGMVFVPFRIGVPPRIDILHIS